MLSVLSLAAFQWLKPLTTVRPSSPLRVARGSLHAPRHAAARPTFLGLCNMVCDERRVKWAWKADDSNKSSHRLTALGNLSHGFAVHAFSCCNAAIVVHPLPQVWHLSRCQQDQYLVCIFLRYYPHTSAADSNHGSLTPADKGLDLRCLSVAVAPGVVVAGRIALILMSGGASSLSDEALDLVCCCE